MAIFLLANVPSSNFEFEDIEAELQRRGVEFETFDVGRVNEVDKVFTRIYRISRDQRDKLPMKNGIPYLPVDADSGHKLKPDLDVGDWVRWVRWHNLHEKLVQIRKADHE